MMQDLYHIADKLGNGLLQKGLRISTAESCTGGGLAYSLTAIPGSSAWFDRGWVTYTNESKHELLGVAEGLISQYGAVSEEVVSAMAQGGLQRAKADYCIAITGIAGPTGGTADKPVGTVWVAWAASNQIIAKKLSLHGDRDIIRRQTILTAMHEGFQLWCR